MGAFADLFKAPEAAIPEEKKEEFAKRVEIVFKRGGMMDTKQVNLFEKTINFLVLPAMDDTGMFFSYNYFEDDMWETAGFNKEYWGVWSQKIGSLEFRYTILAAYVLQELYTKGISGICVEGRILNERLFIAWLNHLFNEKYQAPNGDPWNLFEMFEANITHMDEDDWDQYNNNDEACYGYYEILAVLKGSDYAIERLKENNKIDFIGSLLELAKTKLTELKQQELSGESSLPLLLTRFKEIWSGANYDTWEKSLLTQFITTSYLSDMPAATIKIIAEAYNEDFWHLWGQVKNSINKKDDLRYSEKTSYYTISTESLFHCEIDDLIYQWNKDNPIKFSPEQEAWFTTLKHRHEQLVSENFTKKGALRWIVDMLSYAHETYFRIFAFDTFFEETLDNLNDTRYLALWQIFSDLLYSPELEAAGAVIWAPNETSEQNSFQPLNTRRRLKDLWSWIGFTSPNERNNQGRKMLKRYLALVANVELRKTVFGF